jgi:Domain of unknown function (DUF4082)/Fibronectin type III domain
MNAKIRTTCALFASLALIGATIGSFAASASAAPVCANICRLGIGHPPTSATGSQELGVQFRSDIAGWVAGVCFWVAATETGTHTASIWDSSGTSVGTATSTVPDTPGEQTCVDFNPVVPITPNAAYTASYTSNTAFGLDPGQFFSPLDDPPLHAPMDAGVSGAAGSFPTTDNMGDGYGVNIAFIDTQSGLINDCSSSLTAPTNLSSAPGNASAVVSWAPAQSTPPNCIAGYVVMPFLNGVAQKPTVINGNGTTTVISGLANGQSYTFTVAAQSGRTVGPASTPTGPVTVGSPTAPTALKVTRMSSGKVKVSFKASRNNHSAVTKYTTTCTSGGLARTKAGKSSPLVVAGLSKGHTYKCTVRGTNHRGAGPWSKRSAAVKV